MALFKPFYGTEDELTAIAVHDGYCYLCTDTGKLYADIGTERKVINSDGVVDDTNDITYTGEDITSIKSNATANTMVAYTATLAAASWVSDTTGYKYTYSNTNLTCGASGSVPPIITYTSNQDEYNYIDSATATAKSNIVFHATSKPTSAIGIIIMDTKK
jgi:hypothetical protein